MGEPHAHHFIPQCYLKGFTSNGSKKSKLHVVSIAEQKAFETKPENVAHRRDFNRIEGLPAGAVETHLSKFETQVDHALRRIGDQKSLADVDAWNDVLNLAALFAVRHPRQRENVRQFMERSAKVVMGMTLASPDRWASQLRQAREAGAIRAGDPDIPYERMREFYERGEYKVDVPTGRHIEIEFKVHDAVLRTLADREWTLCIARPGAGYLMTSDSPLVLVHTDGTPPSLQNPLGYGLTGTTVFFPINRELVAIGTFEGPPGVRHLDARAVATQNAITLRHADREVYGSDRRDRLLIGDEMVFAVDVPDRLRKLSNGVKKASR